MQLDADDYFNAIITWNTVSKAAVIELKFDVGVPSGKLKNPPKSCIPRRANIKMNKKSRKSRDKMEDIAFIRAITRFLNEDQYLKKKGKRVFLLVGLQLQSSKWVESPSKSPKLQGEKACIKKAKETKKCRCLLNDDDDDDLVEFCQL
jgi:hypothetical protein